MSLDVAGASTTAEPCGSTSTVGSATAIAALFPPARPPSRLVLVGVHPHPPGQVTASEPNRGSIDRVGYVGADQRRARHGHVRHRSSRAASTRTALASPATPAKGAESDTRVPVYVAHLLTVQS